MDNQDLQARVAALEKWKADRERQQITFPLDVQSQRVLNKYFMHVTGSITTVGGASGNTFVEYIGQQANIEFVVSANTYIPYTVNTTTDVFTVTNYNFENGMLVNVATSDTTPAPLVSGTDYYVVNSTGLTFKLSLTFGGAAIDITTTGTGSQYIYFF